MERRERTVVRSITREEVREMVVASIAAIDWIAETKTCEAWAWVIRGRPL